MVTGSIRALMFEKTEAHSISALSSCRKLNLQTCPECQATTDCPGIPLLRGVCPSECPFVVPHSYLSFLTVHGGGFELGCRICV